MLKALILSAVVATCGTKNNTANTDSVIPAQAKSIYDFKVPALDGKEIDFSKFKGKKACFLLSDNSQGEEFLDRFKAVVEESNKSLKEDEKIKFGAIERVDRLAGGRDISGLAPIGIAYVAMGLMASGVHTLVTWRSTTLAWQITNEARYELAGRVLDADRAFLRDHPTGELVSRIDGDVTALTGLLSLFVANVIALVFVAIGGVLVLLWRAPVLAPILVLNKLSPITKGDVMEWLNLHDIFDSEEKRIRASDRPPRSLAKCD